MKEKKEKQVTVNVKSGNSEALKEAYLYVFDKEGQLLESCSLKSGKAELKIKSETVKSKTEMIIGPRLPIEFKGRKLNPIIIKKMGGFNPSIHLNIDNEINIIGLPKFHSPLWDWCLITGNIRKTFTIDGESKILPVCDARVHICEVDRLHWWWPYIPHHIVDNLAEKLRELLINPEIVFPPKGPWPEPDPVPFDKFERISAQKNIAPLVAKGVAVHTLTQLPQEIQQRLLSPSKTLVHETILNNFHLFHPYLCYWPWFWPYFYNCNEIATVYSDCNGQFNHEYLNFSNDKDIYIWVEVNIDGEWKTVYRPPIPCNTKWDYTCGSDININITDPRVLPCTCSEQLKGELVWFRSIGQNVTALHIEQTDTNNVIVQGVNLRNVGCSDLTDTKGINPFGGSLAFKLLFGDGLPKTDITHYRWRKTNTKNAALLSKLFPGTEVVKGAVRKNYFIITTDTLGNMHFETKSVTLGAEGIGENIGYRIPHWNIYQDPGVPLADKSHTIQWASPDFWSAAIDSTSLEDGLWRFDLELLKPNDAGVFEVVNVPKQVFQVSNFSNSGLSINAPNNYLNIVGGNARNLKVKVRVDNMPCAADIQDANITVGTNVEYSGPCGFLHYADTSDEVQLSFIASQPRNFATFRFSVVKGNNTNPIDPNVNQIGYVISSAGDYSLSGEIFSRKVTAGHLLGTCNQAAFSENLYVSSLATNGTERLREYDRSDTNAFALSTT